MAFNPSPKIKAARDFGNSFDKKMVIIMSVDNQGCLEYASYGRTKNLCDNAKAIADALFDYLENVYGHSDKG